LREKIDDIRPGVSASGTTRLLRELETLGTAARVSARASPGQKKRNYAFHT